MPAIVYYHFHFSLFTGVVDLAYATLIVVMVPRDVCVAGCGDWLSNIQNIWLHKTVANSTIGSCTDLHNLARGKCISFRTIDTGTNSESEKWKWKW
jgi:hypothetical protein